jgi:hypothetical protein
VIVSIVRIIYVYLVSRSTTTIIILFLSEISNFVIKSIVNYSYSYIGISVIFISPYSTCRDSLFY